MTQTKEPKNRGGGVLTNTLSKPSKKARRLFISSIAIFTIAIICIPLIVVFGGNRTEAAGGLPRVTTLSTEGGGTVHWDFPYTHAGTFTVSMWLVDAAGNSLDHWTNDGLPGDIRSYNFGQHRPSFPPGTAMIAISVSFTDDIRWWGWGSAYWDELVFMPVNRINVSVDGARVRELPFDGTWTNELDFFRTADAAIWLEFSTVNADSMITFIIINDRFIKIEPHTNHSADTRTIIGIAQYSARFTDAQRNRVSIEVRNIRRDLSIIAGVCSYEPFLPPGHGHITLINQGGENPSPIAIPFGWHPISAITPTHILNDPRFRGWALSPSATVPTVPNAPSGGIMVVGDIRLYAVFI